MKTRLASDGKIMVSEDCADIVSILPMALPPVITEGRVSGEMALDIVYRTAQGELSAVRKTVSVQGECEGRDIRLTACRLGDVYFRTDGAMIESHASLDVQYRSESVSECSAVTGLTLDEESPYDFSSFPTVTLVRSEGEELWEVARRYHSSVEEIEAVNGKEESYTGRLLLIPKGI